DGGEGTRTTRFEIDRLPHSARFAVALLPLELERMRRVIDADDETVSVASTNVRRELEGEWRISALVLADALTVEPDRRAPVRRAEDDEDAPSTPASGNSNRARVPPEIAGVGDSRQRRAPRERHDDLARTGETSARPPRLLASVAAVEREAPT